MEGQDIKNADKKLGEKLTCEFEILTPVHVGSGDLWQQYIDYVIEDGKIWVIEQDKLYRLLLDMPYKFGKSALDGYVEKLGKSNKKEVEDFLRSLDIEWEDISSHSFDYDKEPANDIRELVRTGMGKPFIPGSSINGAVRSALLYFLFEKIKPKNVSKYTATDLLGNFEQAITRYILPYDVEIGKTVISNIELFNLYGGTSWKSNYKPVPSGKPFISAETFSVGAKGNFSISVANVFLEIVKKQNKSDLYHRNADAIIIKNNPIQFIFNIINEYTQEHIRKEIEFFKKYPQAKGTDLVIAKLQDLLYEATNNADSCILRLSYGGGFHSMTGDFRFDNHLDTIEDPDTLNLVWNQQERKKVPARYKSRRIVINPQGYFPMGFVRISLPKEANRIEFKQKNIEKISSISVKGDDPKNTLEVTKQTNVNIDKESIKTVSAKSLNKDSIFFAEIVKFAKPFSRVKLLLSDYQFALEVEMSGVKGFDLKPGDTVRVKINSQTGTGEIKTVTLFK